MDHPTSRMKQAFDSFSKRNKDKLGAGAASIPQKGPDKILLDENADPIEVDPDISDRETLAADVDAPMDLSEEWMAAYEIARKQLTKKEYEWLKAAQSKNKSGASLLVETTKLREDAAKKDWTMKWGGKDVVVKDKAAKLLRIIQKHAKVIDIAVGHSPEISSLIWSGLRLLLQLALNGLETLQILEEAMGTVAINMAEAQIYASVYKGALDGVTLEGEYAQATLKENIENALPDFYAAILVFLVKAKYYYKPMGAKGRLKLLLLPASEGLKEQVDGINACLRRLMVLASAATMVRTKDAAAASVDVKHSLGEITHMSTLNVSLNKGLHNAIKDHSNLLQEIIETSTASLEKLTGTYQNVTDLLKLLEDGSAAMMVELQALSLRAGYTSRLIASISFETADIKETVRDLHTTTNETSERVEDISQDTGEIKQTTKSAEQAMKEVKGLLLREQEERFKQQTANIRKNLLAALAPHIAESASFNSRFWEHKDKCLEGTREVILKDIWDWSQTADPGKSVYWLAGMAGTGKSTIALTAATEFKNQGRLGASFFFSRQHAELGNSSRFVATVCVMLLLGFPEVAMVLKTVFENDPQICSRGFREQWRQLVVLPLQQLYAIGPLKSPIIIVIDALDECEDEQGVKYILEALSQITSVGEFGLRVLLTSRPEHAINSGIREYLSSLHQFFALHDIERQIVDNDIKIYLTNELEKICCEGGIPRSQWPGQQDIDSLLRNSEQLFLYASTVCIFLRQMIRQLGGITHALRVIVSDFRGMDALYGGVLAHALQEYKAPALEAFRDDLEHNLKRIVGGIVTMLKPLSPKSLAELLDIQAFFDIRLALMNLSSIVQISQRDSDDDDDGCIRLLHLSFREFVLDEDRCRRDTFGVDERLAHGSLAEQCLTYMSKFLKEDMCGLGVPGFYRKDIEEQTIAGTFSPTFRYAVSYWGQHLQRSHMQLEDNDQTHTFLRAHYIHLVEAVTLLDLYPQTIRLFRELAERFVVQDRHDNSEFYKLLRNAEIFMWKHQAEIREAPLQIYSYAIAFSPTCFTDTFPASLPPWLQTPQPHGKYHMPRDWSPELLRFKFSIPPRPMEYDENDIPGRENYTVGFFMTDLVGVSQLFGAAPSRKGPHYPLLWSYTTGSQFKQQEVTDFIHNFYFGQHVENSFWSFQDSVRLWCSGSLVVAMSHPRTSGIVQIDIWEAADISNYTHTSTPVATITLPINTINRDIFFGYNPEGNTCTQPGSRVVFSPDGNSIAIVVPKNMGGFHLWCKKYQNGLIRIPDGTLGVRPRFGNILQVVLSSEGDTVLILMLAPDAVAFEIHLIDTTTGLLRSRIHVPESNVRAKLTVGARKRMGCAISPDCSSIFLAAAGNPSIASSHILWRLESDGSSYSAQFLDWNSEENLKDAECPVFSANGKLLAVACQSARSKEDTSVTLVLCETNSYEAVSTTTVVHGRECALGKVQRCFSLAFSHDSHLIAMNIQLPNEIVILDVLQLTNPLSPSDSQGKRPGSKPENLNALMGGMSGLFNVVVGTTAAIWTGERQNSAPRRDTGSLQCATSGIDHSALSSDGSFLALSNSCTGQINLWDLRTHKGAPAPEPRVLNGYAGRSDYTNLASNVDRKNLQPHFDRFIFRPLFIETGTMLLFPSRFCSGRVDLKCHDIVSDCTHTIRTPHSEAVYSVKHINGFFATLSYDGTMALWDTRKRLLLFTTGGFPVDRKKDNTPRTFWRTEDNAFRGGVFEFLPDGAIAGTQYLMYNTPNSPWIMAVDPRSFSNRPEGHSLASRAVPTEVRKLVNGVADIYRDILKIDPSVYQITLPPEESSATPFGLELGDRLRPVRSIGVSPDGKLMGLGGEYGLIEVRHLTQQTVMSFDYLDCRYPLLGRDHWRQQSGTGWKDSYSPGPSFVDQISFSPDGRWLVAAYRHSSSSFFQDGPGCMVYDSTSRRGNGPVTGSNRRRKHKPDKRYNSVVLVRVWEIATREQRNAIFIHSLFDESHVSGLGYPAWYPQTWFSFSPDGQSIEISTMTGGSIIPLLRTPPVSELEHPSCGIRAPFSISISNDDPRPYRPFQHWSELASSYRKPLGDSRGSHWVYYGNKRIFCIPSHLGLVSFQIRGSILVLDALGPDDRSDGLLRWPPNEKKGPIAGNRRIIVLRFNPAGFTIDLDPLSCQPPTLHCKKKKPWYCRSAINGRWEERVPDDVLYPYAESAIWGDCWCCGSGK